MKKMARRLSIALLAMLMLTAFCVTAFAATTVTVLDGAVSISDTENSTTVSGGDVKVTVTGKLFKQNTNTIKIYNDSGSKATLSFNYVADNYASFSEANASGTKSVVLDAGGTITMSIQNKSSVRSTTATLTLSNFSLVAAAASSDVTVTYDSSLGSVTADGAAVANGGVVTGVTVDTGTALVATPDNGAQFLGWVDTASGLVLSTNTSYTLTPTQNMTVKAAFASSAKAWFMVNNSYLFDDLNAANDAAASVNNKTIVLMNSGTLAAGNYTIDAGVTLLIPFDSANTLYTTEPAATYTESLFLKDGTYTTPTAFRTLTLAQGANLSVNGSISISGKHSPRIEYNGCPSGPQGFVKMNTGSHISVENGGALYAWGYITGTGSVDVKSGGSVYENFQVKDFRGGDASTDMAENTNRVFLFSQYYLQNIEVPLTIYSGAKEYGYMSVNVSKTVTGSDLLVVGAEGDDAMFKIGSGYIIKDYLENQGRIEFKTYGDFSVSSISASMGIGTTSIDINSADFNLPIPSHMTVKAVSGSFTIAQSMALLPGSELYVGADVEATLGEGTKVVVYDLDQWKATYMYNASETYKPLTYAPGGLGTTGREKDALVEVNGTVDASKGAVYTTASGANIYSTGSGVVITVAGGDTVTYQGIQTEVNSDQVITYEEISVTPAKAKNADGSYLSTADATESSEYNYNAEHGKWVKGVHTISSVVTLPTCTTVGYTTHTCACGYSYTDSEVAANGHSWSAWSQTTAPSCTEEGVETRTCTVAGCGATETQSVAALGHTWVDADCTTPKTCSVCDATEGEALGHSWSDWAEEVAPTCTATGTEVRSCGSCGVTEAQDIAPLGHDYSSVVTAPTCTADGYTTHTCGRCDDTYTDGETPATGHNYEAVATAPTCTAAGYTTYTCSNCGDIYTDDETAALGHTEVIDAGVAATCTTAGKTEGKHCSVCKEVLVAQEVVPAKGHTEVIDAAVSATLSNTGLTEGKHCSVCNEVLVAQQETAALMKAEWSMTLSDDLSVNFFIDVDDSVAANTSITVSFNGAETVYKVGDAISVKVAAAQMNDVITVTVVNGDDSVTNKYTVKGYADAIMADMEMSQYHTLVQAMLNYGGAAQTYFGYNKDNLVSSEIVDVELPEAPAMSVEGSAEGIRFYGATLVYRERIAVRFYFTGSSEGIEGAVVKGDLFYVEVADILPQNLDQAVTVTVGGLTVSYSPMNYIVRMNAKGDESLQNLMKALYSYHVAAKALAAE